MKIDITLRAPCRCPGCRHYEKSKEGGRYCSNPRAAWYLYCTGCRCDLKEPEELSVKEQT